jgi:hypothetical protein
VAGKEDFLSRWSRRKVEARSDAPVPAPALPADRPDPEPAEEAARPPAVKPPLPAVESLTPESDFAPFMAADVDGGVRRQALKTLFSDPRFNVMDMMDVYVDDYSKPDPIPESWMGKLEQLSRLGDRAGRDREEAERRRALAQDVAEAREAEAGEVPEVAPAQTPDALDTRQAESGGLPDPVAAVEPAGETNPGGGTIPPPEVRESAP